MRLIVFELKKIWQPHILLALTLLALVFSYLFLSFPITHFPNGHPFTEQYNLMKQWTEKYGETMDKLERADAEHERLDWINQANAFLKTNNHFAEEDIHSYADWQLRKEENGSVLRELFYSESGNWLGYRMDVLDHALLAYDARYDSHLNTNSLEYTPHENRRIDYLIQEEKLNGIMPYVAMENILDYSSWGIIFILLSIFILIMPTITRDRLENLRQLQWSSKCGRKILSVQLIAILLSTILLVMLELAILLAAYSTLDTQAFWKNPINSFFDGQTYWFDLTYGQYVLCILSVVSLLAIGAAGISFAISCCSDHYIALLFKAVPLFVILVFISNVIIDNFLSFNNALSNLINIAGIEILTAFIVFFMAMVLCAIILHKERPVPL